MSHYLSFPLAKQLHEAGVEFECTEKAYLVIEGREPYQGIFKGAGF